MRGRGPRPGDRETLAARGATKIDWFLCRGPTATDPSVLPAVDRQSGEVLSDHGAIALTVGLD